MNVITHWGMLGHEPKLCRWLAKDDEDNWELFFNKPEITKDGFWEVKGEDWDGFNVYVGEDYNHLDWKDSLFYLTDDYRWVKV